MGAVLTRPTNEEVCREFRALLTTGFYCQDKDAFHDLDRADTLAATKPWRGDLWKAFKEIEARLCPSKEGGPRV